MPRDGKSSLSLMFPTLSMSCNVAAMSFALMRAPVTVRKNGTATSSGHGPSELCMLIAYAMQEHTTQSQDDLGNGKPDFTVATRLVADEVGVQVHLKRSLTPLDS